MERKDGEEKRKGRRRIVKGMERREEMEGRERKRRREEYSIRYNVI